MSNITLPNIPHATVTLNERNRVIIRMDDGWVFWDTRDFGVGEDFVEPFPQDICYYRYGSFSPQTDFSTIIVVDETTIPADQIYGGGNNDHEIM